MRRAFWVLERLLGCSAALSGLFLINVWNKPAGYSGEVAVRVNRPAPCRPAPSPTPLLLSRALVDCRLRWPRPLFDRTASAVDEVSRAHGYAPEFILSVIKNESTFQVGAVSPKGAVGLMQLLPATARSVASEEGIDLDGASLFDSALNIRLGFAYLKSLEARYGSVDAALVVYNAGPQALRRGGQDGLPRMAYRRDIEETRRTYALWLKSP